MRVLPGPCALQKYQNIKYLLAQFMLGFDRTCLIYFLHHEFGRNDHGHG